MKMLSHAAVTKRDIGHIPLTIKTITRQHTNLYARAEIENALRAIKHFVSARQNNLQK